MSSFIQYPDQRNDKFIIYRDGRNIFELFQTQNIIHTCDEKVNCFNYRVITTNSIKNNVNYVFKYFLKKCLTLFIVSQTNKTYFGHDCKLFI